MNCLLQQADKRGVSLLEVMVVLTVIGVLISASAPSFQRSIQQSRVDIVGANLQAVWTAERLYWLENRTFTADLSELELLGILDPTVVSGSAMYAYAIASADATTFTATATRMGSLRWSGQLTITENGLLGGAILATGESDLVPGFQ